MLNTLFSTFDIVAARGLQTDESSRIASETVLIGMEYNPLWSDFNL